MLSTVPSCDSAFAAILHSAVARNAPTQAPSKAGMTYKGAQHKRDNYNLLHADPPISLRLPQRKLRPARRSARFWFRFITFEVEGARQRREGREQQKNGHGGYSLEHQHLLLHFRSFPRGPAPKTVGGVYGAEGCGAALHSTLDCQCRPDHTGTPLILPRTLSRPAPVGHSENVV
jgi:hypothetical protein